MSVENSNRGGTVQKIGVLAGAIGIVAGLFIVVGAPNTQQMGQQEMIAWGVGLLLVLEGISLLR